ncbi:hypothetical protein EMMF5_006051 [Cystobasidiomycetes sp. EMM_F5]
MATVVTNCSSRMTLQMSIPEVSRSPAQLVVVEITTLDEPQKPQLIFRDNDLSTRSWIETGSGSRESSLAGEQLLDEAENRSSSNSSTESWDSGSHRSSEPEYYSQAGTERVLHNRSLRLPDGPDGRWDIYDQEHSYILNGNDEGRAIVIERQRTTQELRQPDQIYWRGRRTFEAVIPQELYQIMWNDYVTRRPTGNTRYMSAPFPTQVPTGESSASSDTSTSYSFTFPVRRGDVIDLQTHDGEECLFGVDDGSGDNSGVRMFHVSPGLRVEAVRGHPQRRSLGSEDGHVRVADAPSGAIQGGRRNPTPSGRPLPAGGMPFTVSSPNRDSDTSGGYNLGGSGLVHLSPMPSSSSTPTGQNIASSQRGQTHQSTRSSFPTPAASQPSLPPRSPAIVQQADANTSEVGSTRGGSRNGSNAGIGSQIGPRQTSETGAENRISRRSPQPSAGVTPPLLPPRHPTPAPMPTSSVRSSQSRTQSGRTPQHRNSPPLVSTGAIPPLIPTASTVTSSTTTRRPATTAPIMSGANNDSRASSSHRTPSNAGSQSRLPSNSQRAPATVRFTTPTTPGTIVDNVSTTGAGNAALPSSSAIPVRPSAGSTTSQSNATWPQGRPSTGTGILPVNDGTDRRQATNIQGLFQARRRPIPRLRINTNVPPSISSHTPTEVPQSVSVSTLNSVFFPSQTPPRTRLHRKNDTVRSNERKADSTVGKQSKRKYWRGVLDELSGTPKRPPPIFAAKLHERDFDRYYSAYHK